MRIVASALRWLGRRCFAWADRVHRDPLTQAFDRIYAGPPSTPIDGIFTPSEAREIERELRDAGKRYTPYQRKVRLRAVR